MGGPVDRDLIRYIGDSLRAPRGSLGGAAKSRREAAIAEASAWPSGPSVRKKIITEVFAEGDYVVSLGKPGKEAAPGYDPHNPSDMTPIVHYRGGDLGYLPSFTDLFVGLQNAATDAGASNQSLLLLGHLMARSAYMLDHREYRPGVWRYAPPDTVMSLLSADIGFVDGLPLRVFLEVLEAIALNEDVKYSMRSGRLTNAGRVNTMLTFAHLCAVFANRAGLGSFAGAFARPPIGVAPLSQTDVRRVFPLLEPDTARIEAAEKAVEPVRRSLRRFVGSTADSLAALTPGTRISAGNKGRLRIVVDRLLQAELGPSRAARSVEAVTLKVLRVRDDMTPAEDVSFAAFDNTAVLRESWPKSSFREDIYRPTAYVVFAAKPRGSESFLGVFPAVVPLEDIEGPAFDSWRRTTDALRAARRDLLPLSSESPFFVRNHAGQKVVNDEGETVTPLSFWLSKHYVRELLLATQPGDHAL